VTSEGLETKSSTTMSERKGIHYYIPASLVPIFTLFLVLNKYFPPDFDPDLIPRRKLPKDSEQVVCLMAPFSMYVHSFIWGPY
jgi:hypothetical protein